MTQAHLVHVADSHYSHRQNGRIDECERVHNWILEDAEKRGATHGSHAGDIFHEESGVLERLSVWKFFKRATSFCPWIVSVGNHDVPHDLDIVSSFGTTHPVYVAEYPERFVVNGVEFLCLPDTRRTDLVKELGVDARANVVSEEQLMGAAKARIAKLATDHPKSDLPRVLLCHAMLTDAKPSNDQPIVRGVELNFHPNDFAPLDCDVYLFGHVHAGQSFRIGNRLGYYPGAPFATTYGELGPKRYLMVHLDGHHVEVEPVPIPAVKLVLLMAGLRDNKVHLEYGPEHNTEQPLLLNDLQGADVRVRLRIPEADRLTGERALADVEQQLLSAGALKVKPELLTEKQNRARVELSEIRKTTLAEEVQSFWTRVKKNVTPEEQQHVLALLPQLEEDVGREKGVRGLIGFDGINVVGVAPYYGQKVHFPLSELPPLVAVHGPNGAGKSMLLGLLLAGAYGEHPTYGSLDALAIAKDAGVRVRLKTSAGHWDIYQDIGQKQTRVFQVGVEDPVFAGGPKKYAKWMEDNLPPYEAVFYGSFLTTKEDSIGKLRDARLKSVVMKAFGMSRYELLAVAANKRANRARDEHLQTKAQRDVLLQIDPVPVRAEVADQEQKVLAAEQALGREQRCRGVYDAWTVRQKEANRCHAAQVEAETHFRTAEQALQDAAVIRAAEVTRKSLERELMTLRAQFVEQEAHVKQAIADCQVSVRAQNVLRAEVKEAEDAWESARRSVETHLPARDAAGRVAFLQQAHAATEKTLHDAKTLLAGLHEDRVQLSHGRAEALKGGVEEILTVAGVDKDPAEDRIKKVKQAGQRTLLRDQTDANDLDDQIAATTTLVRQREGELARSTKALRDAEQLAMRLPLLEKAEANVVDQRAKVQERSARLAEEETHGAELTRTRGVTEADLAVLKTKGTSLREKFNQASVTAGRYQELLKAEGTLDALRDAVSEATSATLRARQAVGSEPSKGNTEVASKALQSERAILSTLQERLRRVESDAVKAAKLEEQLSRLELEASRWARAAEVCGRDGLQAVAVETVCNRIAQTATEIFHRVCGPTWSIRFASTRGGDGKVIEQARWMAKKHADDKEREVRATSGGEEVMLTNAILFAFAYELQERTDRVDATVIVDETSGALRGENQEKWVAILREGANVAGVERVLMVPPDSPTILHIADAQVAIPEDVCSAVTASDEKVSA